MNLTIGIVMLAIGLGMIVFGHRNGSRPLMQSHLIFATYPAMTLVFLAMGSLAIVINL
ncbi:hypothetical protein [Microvirga guangxiensis]|uniref:Uncharacterized protein n=1 Tax=Microvirga guangxiensis TaxID=549386 RepID=A0A1G5JXA2_9HYPH|nr:hypothetical protein [Microvirga guangxiensis]SCY93003.1 hypothetical protein SAMN02927923_02888 [Microvirga guangxiensis]